MYLKLQMLCVLDVTVRLQLRLFCMYSVLPIIRVRIVLFADYPWMIASC